MPSFYRFAVTFRHHDEIPYQMYQFANLIYRDKEFPRDDVDYETLKMYVENRYIKVCEEAFENIWSLFVEQREFYNAPLPTKKN